MGRGSLIRKIAYPLTFILFILISNPTIKLILAILYLLTSYFRGNRIRILNSALLLLTIIIIAGFTPQGEILIDLPFYKVTLEALKKGVYKGSLLIGSLYLSKIITSGTILLPGSLGKFISKVFFYFSQISTHRDIKLKSLISDLDYTLLNLDHNYKSEVTSKNVNYSLFPFISTLVLYLLDIGIEYNILF